MRFYSAAFFQDDKYPPEVEIIKGPKPWPLTFIITTKDKYYDSNRIIFYLNSESSLISFVNSVKNSYSKYRREQGYDK